MKQIKQIYSGKKAAKDHMLFDEAFLSGVDEPTLHFYDWYAQPAVTYGYFIDPAKWLKTEISDIARRPTGGGLIFHEVDLAFTLALPATHKIASLATLERYRLINEQALSALFSLLPEYRLSLASAKCAEESLSELCMAHPTQYDLLVSGKKVGGAAQRKTKSGFIHQCSIFLAEPSWEKIEGLLLQPERVLPALKSCTKGVFERDVAAGFREAYSAKLVAAFSSFLMI